MIPPDPGTKLRERRPADELSLERIVPEIDFAALTKMLASVGAKLLLLAFITPFVIMATAAVFAVGATQIGVFAGWIAAVIFIVMLGLILNHWLVIVRRNFPLDSKSWKENRK